MNPNENLEVSAYQIVADWFLRIKQFKALVKRGKDIDQIQTMAVELHRDSHFGEVYESGKSLCDFIWQDLTDEIFSAMPIKKHLTIAWCFWHLYRIEDIVSNFLIAEQNQIFDERWDRQIHSGIRDTGNALSYVEILELSKKIDKESLRQYCIAVGKNTSKIIRSLELSDLTRKPRETDIKKILQEGGLTADKNSVWLLDFWGGRTIGGLLTIQLTDHHMMHLPGCLEIKRIYAQ